MRKLELLPDAFASLASRLLISGFNRTLSVALRVCAINTFLHAASYGAYGASNNNLNAAAVAWGLWLLLGHGLVAKTQLLPASPTSQWVLWQNRDSLDRTMAHRTTLEAEQPSQPTKPVSKPAAAEQDRERIFDAF